jgi:hypothetical protein
MFAIKSVSSNTTTHSSRAAAEIVDRSPAASAEVMKYRASQPVEQSGDAWWRIATTTSAVSVRHQLADVGGVYLLVRGSVTTHRRQRARPQPSTQPHRRMSVSA